jgi:hypothetical protein
MIVCLHQQMLMLGDAGFRNIALHPLPPTLQQVATAANA